MGPDIAESNTVLIVVNMVLNTVTVLILELIRRQRRDNGR